jgi:hypothetical protein
MAASFSHVKKRTDAVLEQHINSPDPRSPPVIDPKYFGSKFGQSLVSSLRGQPSQYSASKRCRIPCDYHRMAPQVDARGADQRTARQGERSGRRPCQHVRRMGDVFPLQCDRKYPPLSLHPSFEDI